MMELGFPVNPDRPMIHDLIMSGENVGMPGSRKRNAPLPLFLAALLLGAAVWAALDRVDPGTPATVSQTVPMTAATSGPPPAGSQERCVVERVVDGDTLIASVDGVRERIRLIGIDSPEIAATGEDGSVKAGEPYGPEAALRLGELALGRPLRLVRDVSDRDRYDRLLRYVWLEDGTCINLVLVQEGLADAKSYPPDTAMQSELDQAERQAMDLGLGIWSGR